MINVIEDGGVPIPESDEQFQQFMKNEHLVHFVGMLMPPRPGVMECIDSIEQKHFKPGTLRNELFLMRIIDWSDIVWIMISIPIKDKNLAEAVSKECGLRIADGVPTVIDGKSIQTFPGNNERVFTFENEHGHPVYRNDPAVTKSILDAERATFEKTHKKL